MRRMRRSEKKVTPKILCAKTWRKTVPSSWYSVEMPTSEKNALKNSEVNWFCPRTLEKIYDEDCEELAPRKARANLSYTATFF